MTIADVLDWAQRHIVLFLLAGAVILFGGLEAENIKTFETCVLAWCVAMLLSHVSLFVYTPDKFVGRESWDAKVKIFHGCCLLVAVVYAGHYFMEFAPQIPH